VPPETRYAQSGDVSIAYQVIGDGEHDIVVAPGYISNVELAWELPGWARMYELLAKLGRVIVFDKRGTGLSDRATGIAQLETRMDDVRAVMDAAESERAALLGVSEGVPMTLLFAATYPERVTAAVAYGASAPRATWAPDFPNARPREVWLEQIPIREREFGSKEAIARSVTWIAPSHADDDAFIEWWARFERQSASPSAIGQLARMNMEIDIRHVLPIVAVPTILVHRVGDAVPIENSRYMAARIPGAELVELQGEDHAPFINPDQAIEPIAEFLGRVWKERAWEQTEIDRVLATVLFTDIVGSTEKAVELGDREWHELVERHHGVVRSQLARFRGREVDTAGDGFFATFDGPARAIQCACAIANAVRELGIDVRAGLHTGEVELAEDKPRGIAVHIGARVSGQAAPGEVLVSNTVKDLVAGSGIEFEDRGTAELKGVPGEWRLYAVRD
jgi:class 3 adenylate cyclase/alpha-beta hydrolase superfamily lysophospholipase